MKFNKYLLALTILLGVGLMTYQVSHGFFSNTAHSTNNVLSASTIFPTATPTITPTPTITNTPTPSPTTIPIAQTLVMNELLPHSSCTSGNTEGQFLELWNGTATTVNLKDFSLTDGTNTIAIANANTNLLSHTFAILAKSTGVINTCIGDVHGATTVNLGGTVNLNTGTLKLLNSSSTVIDKILWGTGQDLQPLVDQSIERSPLGHDSVTGDNFLSSDFVIRTTPSPGQ